VLYTTIYMVNSIYHYNYYRKQPQNYIIPRWKARGIMDADFPSLLEAFNEETNCQICGVEFENSYDKKRKKVLDHDHDTGEVRYICCNMCNLHILQKPRKKKTKKK
jgi:DNA-directed RNA polymerase subunit RPC12/RpoP